MGAESEGGPKRLHGAQVRLSAHRSQAPDSGRDPANRVLSTKETHPDPAKDSRTAAKRVGWDHDIMVHCHWEYDLRTSIQIAEAVEPIKPLWLEDPLPVDYSESWKRLVGSVARARSARARIWRAARASRISSSTRAATFCIPTCATAADSSKPNGSPIWPTYSGCPWPITIPAASFTPGRPANGRRDPRLHDLRNRHRTGRLDGSVAAARAGPMSSADLFRSTINRGWARISTPIS